MDVRIRMRWEAGWCYVIHAGVLYSCHVLGVWARPVVLDHCVRSFSLFFLYFHDYLGKEMAVEGTKCRNDLGVGGKG